MTGRRFARLMLLAALAGAFLQPLAEGMVARGVQESFGLQSAPRVELESASPLGTLLGRFSEGRIVVEGARIGGVEARRVVVDLDTCDVEVWESVTRGALRTEEPLSGDLRAEISEREVLRLAREAGVPMRGVELQKGRMLVRSEARALGAEAHLTVGGGPVLRGGKLVFEPSFLSAFGVPLPERLADHMLARARFAYPLEELPRGVRLSGVRVVRDSLVLSGEARGLLAGGG